MNTRVQELEQTLFSLRPTTSDDLTVEETSETDYVSEATLLPGMPSVLPAHLDPLSELGTNRRYYNWDVIFTEKPNRHQQTYGTSSTFYFLRRMLRYMDNLDSQKNSGTSLLYTHKPSTSTHHGGLTGNDHEQTIGGCDLSRPTEEASLSNFWGLSDLTAAILVRSDFESYYDTLWSSTRALRSPSALVDIMLALCLQYEAQSSWSRYRTESLLTGDYAAPNTAGMWWYRRSQQMFIDDLEEPSIATFQCHLLSVMWLSNAERHNTAHSVMASGIRIGIVLGLHLEPPQSLSLDESEFRKRLWWCTYALEMKFAMELGRPLAVNCKQVTCTLPTENTATSSGQETELSFVLHLIKLVLATRAVYITFYRRCAEELSGSGKESIYDDPDVLERCAKFMTSRATYIRTWARHVPSILHAERNSGQPFCMNDPRSASDFPAEDFPSRRNIVLELQYHNMALSIFRPFIAFPTGPHPKMANTEMHALSCAKHAIAMTYIIREVCVHTDYFYGSLDVWQWQYSAAVSLVGYVLAYPTCSVATDARTSIEIAIFVLQFGGRQAAAEAIRELIERVDLPNCKAQIPKAARGYGPDLPVVHAPEREIDTYTQRMGGPFDSVSNSMTPGHMAESMLALDDFDVEDCSIFDFLSFDACENF